MNFKSLLRISFSELLNNKKFVLFFVFNLSIGLSGFLILDIFKASLEKTLNEKSKSILSADLEISARRPLTIDEIGTVDSVITTFELQKSEKIEIYSMLASPIASRLVELRGIEANFPFYGEIELGSKRVIYSHTQKEIIDEKKIWVYPETLLQLNLKVGDSVQLGGHSFQISDTIERDGGGVGSGFSFALPVYIGLKQLKKTSLLGAQSTGFYSILYQLKENSDSKKIAKEIFSKIKDPSVQVTTHHNASEQIGRALNRLNDYLGLAALVALFLTCLGTSFLFRSYLAQRFTSIAILKSIGFQSYQIERLYIIQIFTLTLLALIPLITFILFFSPFLFSAIQSAIGFDLILTYRPETFLLLLAVALIGSLLVSYPLIYNLRPIQPKNLFQGSEQIEPAFRYKDIFLYLPTLAFFWLISFFLSKSFQTSTLFITGLVLSFTLLTLVGRGLILTLTKLLLQPLFKVRLPFSVQLSLTSLSRQKFSTLTLFTAIALSTVIMNLIPQIQVTLRNEIESPSGVKIPSLFLFDIQEDQVEPLKSLAQSKGIDLNFISPMIRARLESVNNQPFEKADRNDDTFTREEENENRFRNRGFNLTYRNELSDSESLVSGRLITSAYDPEKQKLPSISLEERFAERLKLKIGDHLKFDIQGVFIEGEVVNLRRVKWTSFQPNFFIQFQTGVLDGAPKTFLAGIPQLLLNKKNELQNEIVKTFPTISIIEVSKVIERISLILDQMSVALQAMAVLSLLVGLVILFSISNQQAESRRKQVNLLKVMGASFSQIRRIFIFEFFILSLVATVLGLSLSFIFSWSFSKIVFDSALQFNFIYSIGILALTLFLTTAVSYIAVVRVLNAKPKELLQQAN